MVCLEFLWGCWSLSQSSVGESLEYPWRDGQSVTRHTYCHTQGEFRVSNQPDLLNEESPKLSRKYLQAPQLSPRWNDIWNFLANLYVILPLTPI